MYFIILLRKIRHKYLNYFSPFWTFLGNLYRSFSKFYKFKCVQYIGEYGPFKFDPEFLFSNYSAFGNKHNRGFNHLMKNLERKKTFFDIGAHIGLVSIPAAFIMDQNSKIVAFEPSDKNYKHLKNHIRANNFSKKIKLYKKLVGEKNCKKNFYYSKYESPLNSIIKVKQIEKYNSQSINQISIDYFCKKSGIFPDIIKIDVEGAELNVLKGAKETILKYKPIIYLSVHPSHLVELGFDLKQLNHVIKLLDYTIEDFRGNKVNNIKFSEYILKPKKISNLY